MVVVPTYSGTGPVDQSLVPVATPDAPVDDDQVTPVTPTLSRAVPLITMDFADVATVVIAGERMVMDGGTVSAAPELPSPPFVPGPVPASPPLPAPAPGSPLGAIGG